MESVKTRRVYIVCTCVRVYVLVYVQPMLQSSISFSIPVLKVNLYSKNLVHIEFYVFMFFKIVETCSIVKQFRRRGRI